MNDHPYGLRLVELPPEVTIEDVRNSTQPPVHVGGSGDPVHVLPRQLEPRREAFDNEPFAADLIQAGEAVARAASLLCPACRQG